NLVLLAACFLVCRQEFSHPGTFGQPRAGLQLFIFYPVIVALLQGQDSVILLLGFCLAYRFVIAKRWMLTGIVLGLMMFKLQIIIPVVVFLTIRYASGLLILGFGGGSALAGALSVATVGWRASVGFLRALLVTSAASLTSNAQHVVL